MNKNFILATVLGLSLSLGTTLANAEKLPAPDGPIKPPCNCDCKCDCGCDHHKGHHHGYHKGHHPCPPHKKHNHELENKLNLTEEQKVKAKEIRMQGREELKPIIDELRVKKEKIREIKDSTLSEKEKASQIEAQRKEIISLREQADKIREKNMAQFEEILTAEQKTEFNKFKQEMKAKHEAFKKQMEQKRQQKMQPHPTTAPDEK